MKQCNRDILAGHLNRMQNLNISEYLTDYKPTDRIKQMIPEKWVLNNLVTMVMVYIMEYTLGEDRKCTLPMIADFLEDVSTPFDDYCNIDDFDELARFIVVGILQHNGKLASFSVYDPGKDKIITTTTRLIDEEAGAYWLTTVACDYLFRTHELSEDTQYNVTKYILKEHLKRENYSGALDKSKELISSLRNISNLMSEFVRKCKENIHAVTIDDYENMMKRYNNVVKDGYGELRDIQVNADNKAKELQKAIEINLNMETKKHVMALEGISRNIDVAIDEMRALINKCNACKDIYKDDIYNGFAAGYYDRFDFEKDIMVPLQNGDLSIDAVYQFFRTPLLSPEVSRILNLESFYTVQEMITEMPDEDAINVDDVEDQNKDIINIRNARFSGITTELFTYMRDREQFRFSEFVRSLPQDKLKEFCEENSLPQVLLSIYDLGETSITEWKAESDLTTPPNGEFDLSLFLKGLPDDLLNIDRFSITKTDELFTFSTEDGTITTNDMIVEVHRV